MIKLAGQTRMLRNKSTRSYLGSFPEWIGVTLAPSFLVQQFTVEYLVGICEKWQKDHTLPFCVNKLLLKYLVLAHLSQGNMPFDTHGVIVYSW